MSLSGLDGPRRAPALGRGPAAGWVLAAVCSAALIVNVDNSILNVALPTLVRQLHSGSSGLQWIVDAYALVFAGLLLTGGSLADRLGRKRLFLIGLAVFAAGSAAAAFSGSVGWLIGWRAVMGAGAAATIPASLSIINEVHPAPAARARAISVWAGVIGLGTAIGPVAGGLLLARFPWGAIFLVNVPIALAACFGAGRLVPESTRPPTAPPDLLGTLLSITGLGLLLWAIIEAPGQGWLSPWVITAAMTSAIAAVIFILWQARCRHPMLNLRLIRQRRLWVAAVGEALGAFGLLGGLFVQTQFLQFDLDYSPLQAGLRLAPLAAMLALTAATAPAAARRIGVPLTAAGGLAAIATGLCLISVRANPATSYGDVLPGMILVGLGAGLLLPSATDSVVGSVPERDSGLGSAINAITLQVGGALGVAVIGSVLSNHYQDQMTTALAGQPVPPAVAHTIVGSLGGALQVADQATGVTRTLLKNTARAAFMSGTRPALGVAAAMALAGAALVLTTLPGRHGTSPPNRPSSAHPVDLTSPTDDLAGTYPSDPRTSAPS
jgi:EmrB/QacA subfamily drug resistance transporter